MANSVNVEDRVQVSNPRHKCYGKLGVVRRTDRGNVWVELDAEQSHTIDPRKDAKDRTICLRAQGLTVKGKN